MDTFLQILGALLVLGGIIGSVLPFLPGPPLAYVGLLVQQLKSDPPYTIKFLLIWAAITIVVSVLDYLVPLYGTKKFGGSKYGMWGCTIGLIVGLFFPPWGLIAGPFIGAFVGELVANNQSDLALRAAFGSFIGFLFGTLLKLVACFMMGWYLIKPWLQ
ncbi:MAG: DUF456 domain-containing protein [Bacteroidota bacterium]|jgi:uncharacterized protein YqgC (DUF456 family)|nr:MAG: DUF456 domain-containing protein [Bacteroidota bacterium]